ncbi:MAG: ATP-binding cassette domain-containing protein [Bacteroides sp.]|nr:ATP-binding cassette domain-containing protein [Roseburia sp.]MCM1347439.1 ATP-binding cassette domain-containing protein [Bacteroides sp.]MCM1421208.1 ATP-binding cassette domain-containing protein [Bacteroides sp.]
MEKIDLQNILPDVFSQRADLSSDIWMQHVSFAKGMTYLVEANSGTGKSSLCSYIFGYRNDYKGNILFDSMDIKNMSVGAWVDLRKRSLSMLWQELRLFPELTAMENVDIKNKLTGFQKKKTIREWFEMLGIADKENVKIGRMSFGQQQRVALIRALCQPFDFILVDEPVSHLDETNSEIMGRILTEEARKQGAGVVVTSIGRRIEIDYDKIFRL